MDEIAKSTKGNSSKSLRLTARIIGTVWVIICLILFVGYYLERLQRNSGAVTQPPDILGIAIVISMGVALAGLIIAWWSEGPGGFISLIGFLFAGALLIIDPKLNFSPVFFVLFVPAMLYLSYWKETKNSR